MELLIYLKMNFHETFLKFIPNDPFNKNYDIKLIEQTFNDTNFLELELNQ